MSCASKKCERAEVAFNQGALSLAKNIFGPFGDRLIEGYCRICAQRNVARAWMLLIISISVFIVMIEFPWKGPLFAIGMCGVWTVFFWSWLFPKEN